MCDDSHAPVKKKEKDRTIRFEIEINESSDKDSYIHVDYLELSRAKKKQEKKALLQQQNSESVSKASEDPEADALARYYEEKYGHCNDYAELGEGYDDDDSFIDNSAAINDLLPSGLQAELGGFYINRGKLLLVKEDTSGSETEDDKSKPAKRISRRITSDSEEDGKRENGRISDNAAQPAGRKRSAEYSHKRKNAKIFRKMATPRIPAHLLQKKPFTGSEFSKNLSEMKKNKIKNADVVEKLLDNGDNKKEPNHIQVKRISTSKLDASKSHDWDDVIESVATGTHCAPTGLDLHNVDEAIEAVATGADLAGKDKDDKEKEVDESSSTSSSSSSSSSDSDSDSSGETSEKTTSPGPGKSPVRVSSEPMETSPRRTDVVEPVHSPVATTPVPVAVLDDGIRQLIAQITAASREEKCRQSTQRLNKLLLNLHERLRDRSTWEQNSAMDQVSLNLLIKKTSIIKRIKKLQFTQLEYRMSGPMKRLKEAVAEIMLRRESEYIKEFTKAAGTTPQIYAELSHYYWNIDPGTLPPKKFPWDDTLRGYLYELVRLRKNCYFIMQPRNKTLAEYIHGFLESRVKTLWPKDWMTVEILLREASNASSRSGNDAASRVSSLSSIRRQTSSPVIVKKKVQPMSKPELVQRKPSIIRSPHYPQTNRTKTIELTGNVPSPAKDCVEPEILNLTKNPAVSISKIANRSASPNLHLPLPLPLPLPAGTTISPASFQPAKPKINSSSNANANPPLRETSVIKDSKSLEVLLTKQDSSALSREVEISIAKPVSPHKDVWREDVHRKDVVSITKQEVIRKTDEPSVSEFFDRYKNNPRKRAVQEFMENQHHQHEHKTEDKGFDVFTRMLDNYKAKNDPVSSSIVGSISVKKFAKTEPQPGDDKLKMEMSRVMQNIMELSSMNAEATTQENNTGPSSFTHALQNNHLK